MNIGDWALGIGDWEDNLVPSTLKNRTLDWRQLLSLKSRVRKKIVYSAYCHESFCAFLAVSFFTDFGSSL
jgi:hypothetical protein